jgi:hypothetical protein
MRYCEEIVERLPEKNARLAKNGSIGHTSPGQQPVSCFLENRPGPYDNQYSNINNQTDRFLLLVSKKVYDLIICCTANTSKNTIFRSEMTATYATPFSQNHSASCKLFLDPPGQTT